MFGRTFVATAIIAVLIVAVGCSDTADPPAPQATRAETVVRIEVSASGFSPNNVELRPDVPAVLEFVRTDERTCATAVVFQESGLRHDLPLNEPVRVSVQPSPGQRFEFTCPMDMYKGWFGTAQTTEKDNMVARPDANGLVEIEVDAQGFHPARIQVSSGKSAVLRFTRTADKTCNTGLLIPGLGIEESFALNEPFDVTITPENPGEIEFSCPMNMSKGVIDVIDGSEK